MGTILLHFFFYIKRQDRLDNQQSILFVFVICIEEKCSSLIEIVKLVKYNIFNTIQKLMKRGTIYIIAQNY